MYDPLPRQLRQVLEKEKENSSKKGTYKDAISAIETTDATNPMKDTM
jgi:hypothetical protein